MFLDIIVFIIQTYLQGFSSDLKNDTYPPTVLDYLQSPGKHVELVKYLREHIYLEKEFKVDIALLRKFINDRHVYDYKEVKKAITAFESADCKFVSSTNLQLMEAKLLADLLRDNYEQYRQLKAKMK